MAAAKNKPAVFKQSISIYNGNPYYHNVFNCLSESTIKSYWRLLIDLSLIVLTLIGGYLAVQSGRQRALLSSQVARIEKRIGSFPISDPRLVHIQAIETENRLEFAWRIYLPANYKMTRVLQLNSSGSSSGEISTAKPFEMIARVFLREENGLVECFSSFGFANSVSRIQWPIYADAIREKRNQLKIEQLGKNKLVTFEPDDEFTLLRIAIPIEMIEEMKSKDESGFKNLSGEIVRVQFLRQAP